MKIPVKWNTKNKFCVLRLHYSVDPDKSTSEWLAKAKEGTSDRGWNREYEISYDTFEGEPVYQGFKDDHIQSLDYEVGQYVYRGWDFGYHHPAVVFGFMSKNDQLIVRKEILGENIGIKEFAQRVLKDSQVWFPSAQWLDSCDPAGHQKNDKSEFTSVEILNQLGVHPVSKKTSIEEGLEIVRQRLLRRNDGQYGFLIHPDCKILIAGFKGGYRYPEKIEGRADKQEPLKEGYYEHLHDGLRYMCVNFLELAQTHRSVFESPAENEIMNTNEVGINEFF